MLQAIELNGLTAHPASWRRKLLNEDVLPCKMPYRTALPKACDRFSMLSRLPYDVGWKCSVIFCLCRRTFALPLAPGRTGKWQKTASALTNFLPVTA